MGHIDPSSEVSKDDPSDTPRDEQVRATQRLRDLFVERGQALSRTRGHDGRLEVVTAARQLDAAHLIRLGFATHATDWRCPIINILDALTNERLLGVRYAYVPGPVGEWSVTCTRPAMREYVGPFPLETGLKRYDEGDLMRIFAAELDRFAGLPAARTELERFHARVLHEFERAGIALTPNTPGDSLRGFCSPPRSLGDGWEASFYVSEDFAGENAAIQLDVSKEGAYGGLALLLVPQLMEDGAIGFDYEVSADGYRGLRPNVSIVCETEADGVGLIRTCAQLYVDKAVPIAAPAP